MKFGVFIAAATLALSSANLYAADAYLCNLNMEYYQKYLKKYQEDTKKDANTYTKKTDTAMLKNYQDELLEGCEGIIDLREVKENKYMVDTAYKLYH